MGNVLRLVGLLLGLLGQPMVWAQAPAWQSAIAVGQHGNVAIQALATDASGNIYIAGGYFTAVSFGNIALANAGGYDIFVAKYQPATASFVWAQRAGGGGDDVLNSLVVSGTSLYITGSFNSPAATFGATTLASTGGHDVFVAKLADAGSTASFVWAQRAGGAADEYSFGLGVSGTSVYIAGSFSSSTVAFGTSSLTNAGQTNIFVAKLTDAGTTGSFIWAQRAGGTASDYGNSLAVSGTSVYVAGSFNSPAATFGATTLTNAGQGDFYVAKLTDAGSAGNFGWAQRAGGTGSDYAFSVAASGTSIYVSGEFNSAAAVIGATTLASAGGYDIVVAKLTDAGATGSFTWAQRAGGTGDDKPNALAVSGTSLYVTGQFQGAVAMFGATTLASTGASDLLVARLTDTGPTGSFAWAQRAGGTGDDIATAMAVVGSSVYTAGFFSGPTATFGTTTLTNTAITEDFLASIQDQALASSSATVLSGLTIFPNPAHGTATVRLPPGPAATLTLLDALGRVVCTHVAPAGADYALCLVGLTPGVYALRVQLGQQQAVRQVVVE